MTKIVIRPATLADAEDIVSRLRGIDKLELALAHDDFDILKALKESFKASNLECEVAVIDGTVEAIFGLSEQPQFNVPWMLGTDVLLKHQKSLCRLGKAQLRYWADRYDAPPRNLVWGGNYLHIAWLKRMGCRFNGAVHDIGDLGIRFLEFDYV